METDLQGIDVHAQAADGPLHPAWVRGPAPQELVLSDGSRLRLSPPEQGPVHWQLDRAGDRSRESLTTQQAHALTAEHERYVLVRTRAEAEWLRAVGDWCRAEAGRLDEELAGCGSGPGRGDR